MIHVQLLEVAVRDVVAAPIGHIIKLYAVGELHGCAGWGKPELELELELSQPAFSRRPFSQDHFRFSESEEGLDVYRKKVSAPHRNIHIVTEERDHGKHIWVAGTWGNGPE